MKITLQFTFISISLLISGNLFSQSGKYYENQSLYHIAHTIEGINYNDANNIYEAYHDDVCFEKGHESLPPTLDPPTNLELYLVWATIDIELIWDAPGENNIEAINDLQGYNIYYSWEAEPFELLDFTTETTYLHEDNIGYGLHCYYVKALYESGESEPTNTECDLFEDIEENLAATLKVYPNPANNQVDIKSDYMIRNIVIVNFTGQIVFMNEVKGKDYLLDVNEFNPGVYIVRLTTESGVISHRLVIE